MSWAIIFMGEEIAMIAFIRGKLIDVETGAVVIDVGGIGYKVHIPLSSSYQLPARGSEIALHTNLIVRDDGLYLYGFRGKNELNFFAVTGCIRCRAQGGPGCFIYPFTR